MSDMFYYYLSEPIPLRLLNSFPNSVSVACHVPQCSGARPELFAVGGFDSEAIYNLRYKNHVVSIRVT